MEILFKSGTGGSVRVFQPSKTVLLSVFAGNLAGEFVPPVLGAFDEAVRDPTARIHCFHDWAAMTGYDVDARIAFTRWMVGHRRAFASVHFLLGATIVKLGVQAANIVLGGFMTTHSTRADFERAFAHDVGTSLSRALSTR